MPRILRPVLILFAGAVVFANALGTPLLLDDYESISENRQIRDLSTLNVLIPERELPVAGRPLVNLTLAINYAMGAENVRVYHLTNLAFHLLCAVAAFFVLERMLRLKAVPALIQQQASPIATTATLLWVVHPVNSEIVNYLTQRTESLMTLFYLLTLYGSVRALESSKRGWTVFAAVCCALGALCKETMVTAPLAVIAFDRLLAFDSWKDAWRSRRGLYLGLAVSWIVVAALQATDPRPSSAGFGSGVSPWVYLLNQAPMLTRYAMLAVWPLDLVVYYGRPVPLSLADVVLPAVGIIATLGATLLACRRWPALGAAGVWIFLTLAPTSSILPIATEVGAERRMYLPLLAVVVLIACALWRVVSRPWAASAVTAILVLALSSATFARNREYAVPLRLAELTLSRWPTGLAHQWVAEELLVAGRREEAIGHLRTAVVDTPRSHFTLGIELLKDGQVDAAISELQAFVRLEPLHVNVPAAEGFIARAYARQERWDEALRFARQALAKAPNVDALAVVADEAFARSDFAAVVTSLRQYLALRPSDRDALTKLGIAFLATGQGTEGIATFRRITELEPDNWQSRRNLAQALLDVNRPAESVTEGRRAVALNPNDGGSHTVLAQGLLMTGQPAEAVAEFERALALNPADDEARRYLAQLKR